MGGAERGVFCGRSFAPQRAERGAATVAAVLLALATGVGGLIGYLKAESDKKSRYAKLHKVTANIGEQPGFSRLLVATRFVQPLPLPVMRGAKVCRAGLFAGSCPQPAAARRFRPGARGKRAGL